jgi:LAS superfamily LD-carboxypeptidase LdcB
MVRAAKEGGVSLVASSSFRSMAKQQELWNNRANNPNDVAEPGTSNHQMGFAFDFSNGSQSWIWMKSNSESYGYKWRGSSDPVHFSPTGG